MVEDAYQNRGLGTTLLVRLVAYARSQGILGFVAAVHHDNARIMRFIRKSGLPTKSRLEAGEDFDTLAEELSQHEWSKEKGGDLDWVTKDMISSAFGEFVFNTELEINTLSEPIRDETAWTKGGYWLLKVIDEDDNKEIGEDDRNFLKAKALDEWVSSLWDNPENEVDSYLDDEKKIWAIEKVIGS